MMVNSQDTEHFLLLRVVAVVALCCAALILLPKDQGDFAWQGCAASHPAWGGLLTGDGTTRVQPALLAPAGDVAYLLLPSPSLPGDKELWRSRAAEFEVTAASGRWRKPLRIWFEDERWAPRN